MFLDLDSKLVSPPCKTAPQSSSEYFLHINHWLVYFARLEKSEANLKKRGEEQQQPHNCAIIYVMMLVCLAFQPASDHTPTFILNLGWFQLHIKCDTLYLMVGGNVVFRLHGFFMSYIPVQRPQFFAQKFRSFCVVEVFCVIFGAKIQIF